MKNPYKVKVYGNDKYVGKKIFKTRSGAGMYARKQSEMGGDTKITMVNKKIGRLFVMGGETEITMVNKKSVDYLYRKKRDKKWTNLKVS